MLFVATFSSHTKIQPGAVKAVRFASSFALCGCDARVQSADERFEVLVEIFELRVRAAFETTPFLRNIGLQLGPEYVEYEDENQQIDRAGDIIVVHRERERKREAHLC